MMKKLTVCLLALVLVLALAGCGKKDTAVIVAAKDRDGLESGTTLSEKDVTAFLEQIQAAEKEKGWMEGTVSNSIASFYLTVEQNGEKTLYKYSDGGALDDLTNMRALPLGGEVCEALNGILSAYVDLSLPLVMIPELPDLP